MRVGTVIIPQLQSLGPDVFLDQAPWPSCAHNAPDGAGSLLDALASWFIAYWPSPKTAMRSKSYDSKKAVFPSLSLSYCRGWPPLAVCLSAMHARRIWLWEMEFGCQQNAVASLWWAASAGLS